MSVYNAIKVSCSLLKGSVQLLASSDNSHSLSRSIVPTQNFSLDSVQEPTPTAMAWTLLWSFRRSLYRPETTSNCPSTITANNRVVVAPLKLRRISKSKVKGPGDSESRSTAPLPHRTNASQLQLTWRRRAFARLPLPHCSSPCLTSSIRRGSLSTTAKWSHCSVSIADTTATPVLLGSRWFCMTVLA